MKILVVIANYGLKNQGYLERLIDEYRSMSYDIDIVVLSNIPKEFGSDIEVRVGLPAKNPWSLPFGHKELFAERIDEYDLFIYSEDDTLIKQENIDAFLKVTKVLPKNEIAGFLRYEENSTGKVRCLSMPDIHAYYHWLPNSVKSLGEYTFASFSNKHSAFFIRGKVWNDFGGFDEKLPDYGNETELCIRLSKSGWRLVWTQNSYIHHFGNLSYSDMKTPKVILAKAYIREKHDDQLHL